MAVRKRIASLSCCLLLLFLGASSSAAPTPAVNPNQAITAPTQNPNLSEEDAAILQDMDFLALFDLLSDLQLFMEAP